MQKILGNLEKGLAFVLSAPGGTGKTTLAKMLFHEFDSISPSISYTTRKPRPGEEDGRDYYFVSHAEFEEMVKSNQFLEHAKVYQDYYGTSRRLVESEQEKGKHVLLVIDTQGALQLMKSFKAIFIFIKPPSMEVLGSRLAVRRSETDEAIEHRLSWADKEISLASSYDYQIINDDLKIAYIVLKSILIAEEHKNR